MASADLCWNCRSYKEIAYIEAETERHFCMECALQLPINSEDLAQLFLSVTVPFDVGERVQAWTGGQVFDGTGVITEISTNLRNGGTNVYPTFHVAIDAKEYPEAPDEAWYTEICLKKVSA